MPAFIKTPKDEKRWADAKKAASKTLSESDGDSFWKLTNSIYQKMNKAEAVENIQNLLSKAKNRLTEFNPDEEDPYADVDNADAEKWIAEHSPKQEKQQGILDNKSEQKEMDPERLKALKNIAQHWLSHADQVRKQTADAKLNPHLFAEGHRQAAHNAAHEDYNSAYGKFINSDEYKALPSSAKKMRAEIDFKKKWQEQNPDFHANAAKAVGEAHKVHEQAKNVHDKEMNNRKAHILSGGRGASPDEVFSNAVGAQHIGLQGGQHDENHRSYSVMDPAASYANKYSQHLAGEKKPEVSEMDEGDELQNPQFKAIKHPELDKPENKKMINDLFSEYGPLISRSANRARSKAVAMGVPEDKIDMGALHEAGMHGLMQAVHDYHPETGSSFKAHATGKMSGLMQSHIGNQDYIPKDMRAKVKAKEKGILPSAPAQAEVPSEAVSQPAAVPVQAPAPKQDLHEMVANSGHPNSKDIGDRLKRIVVRKKT